MPSQCQICTAGNLPGFEAALAAGTSIWRAAREAGLNYRASARHVQKGHSRRGRRLPARVGSAVDTFTKSSDHEPMDWQRAMLDERRDTVLIKGRQVGATEVASALAIHTAMSKPGSTSAIISPSQRQSSEVTVRARLGFWAMGETLRQDSVSLLRLANGSRVISLPGSARGIRGYAADLVIIDEAAWVPDETFTAARPLTTATGGRFIVQSTPGAPVGAFYDLVQDIPAGWAYMKVRSDEVPTISPERLAHERQSMTAELYAQEYEAEFGTGAGGSLFNIDALRALVKEAP